MPLGTLSLVIILRSIIPIFIGFCKGTWKLLSLVIIIVIIIIIVNMSFLCQTWSPSDLIDRNQSRPLKNYIFVPKNSAIHTSAISPILINHVR